MSAADIMEHLQRKMISGEITSFKDAVELRKRLEENGGEVIDPDEPISIPTELPACAEGKRPVPNAILRSALFGIVAKGARKYEQRVLKAAVNGITVKFTGQQLDQSDLDVWLGCLQFLKKAPAGTQVYFSMYGFLKHLGRNTGKSDREWLRNSLTRLSACLIELGDGLHFYNGHLINDYYRNEVEGEYVLTLNPKILSFFSSELWTGLDLDKRRQLKGKTLSQWLHGFYSTHSSPHPYKVETLKRLCGSEADLKEFRRMLKKALSDLSRATEWICWIDENGLANVKK
ncbi:plasmid replication initiator TrfA [Aeromonas cavernicola]|uniref:TrfA family protein n=1 Tax=Aeromonas cavernicola TaxID=1006623 RepID=A0A2H9U601_9GAMM|nr:plasmid replication initiator TrfA [Aeromonas cavernicola]PJG59465.1 hypothetical protein CUC53_07135 [Aeromonas cavernicola]